MQAKVELGHDGKDERKCGSAGTGRRHQVSSVFNFCGSFDIGNRLFSLAIDIPVGLNRQIPAEWQGLLWSRLQYFQ